MPNIQRLSPIEANSLLTESTDAKLIDTRTFIEFSFIGHPIGAIHIPLKRPPEWQVLANFIERVEKEVPNKATAIILLCRSGARSMQAAELLQQAGYNDLYNMEEGFEGDKDDNNHRGTLGGWRFHGLPWEQS